VVVESGMRYNRRLVAPVIKKDLKGVKEMINSLASKKSKEGIIEVPAGGDTWYVQTK
jgi:hypothetical protein